MRLIEDVLVHRMMDRAEFLPRLGPLLPTIISGIVTALETTISAHSFLQEGPGRPDMLKELLNTVILKVCLLYDCNDIVHTRVRTVHAGLFQVAVQVSDFSFLPCDGASPNFSFDCSQGGVLDVF